MKLSTDQILEIEQSNLTEAEIAKAFNVSQRIVNYYRNPTSREKNKEYMRKWYRRLSKKKKEERKEKWREYQRNYQRTRYQNDPIFREKQLERVKRGKK